jgi:DNA replication and repair protein RecF
MPVTSLTLTNFRSYTNQTLELDPVTLVVGPNATGKTNLLESLFVLATTRSFRAKDTELIRHSADHHRIAATINGAEIALGYQVREQGTEKRVRHDGVATSLIDHLGTLRVVLFEPNDLLIIHGAPDRRRRYLDFILTQTDKRFARTLSQYRRVLLQRNRLLADHHRPASSDLFAWNLQLAEHAALIDAARHRVINHINMLATELYASIAGGPEALELLYRGAAPGHTEADYTSEFLQLLETNLSRDTAAGFTTIGPHRDDFLITFKEAPITTVASRGEMRTVVLALKLAELAYMHEHTGTKPLLLLDDVFSELDDGRRHHLLEALRGHQAVITTTNADVSAELGTKHSTIHTAELQTMGEALS